MSYKQLVFQALICATVLCASATGNAMSYYKSDGVLKIWGEANDSDRTKLQEQLTPDLKTVILLSPTKGSWALARDLAAMIEAAEVTTVTQSFCSNLVCPAMFLAGKHRMFSAVTRPEASSISLPISTEHFPEGGEDSQRPWSDVTGWWRSHTKLGRTEVWPRHVPFIRPAGTLPAENLVFFHPSAKTSKGSAAECWGDKQQLPFCAPMADGKDALSAGVITTLERYVPRNEADFFNDIKPPAATTFAKIGDLLKIERLNESVCNAHYRDFLTYDSPRAFVVSSDGGCFFASAQSATPYATALKNCNTNAAKYPGTICRFYAIDSYVVFTPFSSADPSAPPPATSSPTTASR